MSRFNVDTSNIDSNLEGKYYIEIEGEQIKGFSKEFLEKCKNLDFAERTIQIIKKGEQDRKGNIVGGGFEEIGKIKAKDVFTAKNVQQNIRIIYK